MIRTLAALCLMVCVAGCGSSGGGTPDGGGGGAGLLSFSAFCVAANNAFCTRLYQCEPPTFPGTVAACEATPDNNCLSKACPAGTTFDANAASTCVTEWQNELCANTEAGQAPPGCGIGLPNTNICH
jgi:hypothetical protein